MAPKKGHIRLLADEVERVLLPAVQTMGFRQDPNFAEPGKWNGSAFVWRYLRDEPDAITRLEIAAIGGKSEALQVCGKTFSGAQETPYLPELLNYPLSVLKRCLSVRTYSFG